MIIKTADYSGSLNIDDIEIYLNDVYLEYEVPTNITDYYPNKLMIIIKSNEFFNNISNFPHKEYIKYNDQEAVIYLIKK